MALTIIDGSGNPQTIKTTVAGGQHTTHHISQIEVNGQIVDGTVKMPASGDWLTNTQLRATSVPVSIGAITTTDPLTVAGPMSIDEFVAALPLPVTGPLTLSQLTAATVTVTGALTRTQLDSAAVGTIDDFYSSTSPTGRPWNNAWTIDRTAAGGSANTVDTTKTITHSRQWGATTYYQKWRFNSSGQLLSTSIWGTDAGAL